MSPTLCENCDNVETQSRKSHPAAWLCVKFPRLEGHGYVSHSYWAKNEPWMKCYGINGGQCPLFSQVRVVPKPEPAKKET